jgi:hypothetical protein
MAGARKKDPCLSGRATEKRVGELQEDACAVARVGLSAGSATVGKVLKDGQGILHQSMGRMALNMGHKARATGVMLKAGVVQALLVRPILIRLGYMPAILSLRTPHLFFSAACAVP